MAPKRVLTPTELVARNPHMTATDFMHRAAAVDAGVVSPGFAMTTMPKARKHRKSRSHGRKKHRSASRKKHRSASRGRKTHKKHRSASRGRKTLKKHRSVSRGRKTVVRRRVYSPTTTDLLAAFPSR